MRQRRRRGPNRSVYTTGYFQSVSSTFAGTYTLTSSGGLDAFVAKYSPPHVLTVSIVQAQTQDDPTSNLPIHFTVVFNYPVTDFTPSDVVFGGTAPGSPKAAVSLIGTDGTSYDVTVAGMTGSGTVTASIPAGVAHDALGYANTQSPVSDNSVTYHVQGETTGPTISRIAVVEASGPRDGVLTTSESLFLSFNALDPNGVVGGTLQVDDNNVAPVYGPYTAASGVNFGVIMGTLSAGTHNYIITATDKAGLTRRLYRHVQRDRLDYPARRSAA